MLDGFARNNGKVGHGEVPVELRHRALEADLDGAGIERCDGIDIGHEPCAGGGVGRVGYASEGIDDVLGGNRTASGGVGTEAFIGMKTGVLAQTQSIGEAIGGDLGESFGEGGDEFVGACGVVVFEQRFVTQHRGACGVDGGVVDGIEAGDAVELTAEYGIFGHGRSQQQGA